MGLGFGIQESLVKMVSRPMLNYFGGKWNASEWIISHFPEHDIYVEAFGGGGSILLKKPRSKREVINDIDLEIHNLYLVMRDYFPYLEEKLKLTPHSRTEYQRAYEETTDIVERARRSIIKSYFGIGDSQFHKGNGMRCSKTSNTCVASSWQSYIKHAWEISERFKGVTIESCDYLNLINRYDSPTTLFYFDPPYVRSTRSDRHGYRHDWKDEDHLNFITNLKGIKGMSIVSGYECQLYSDIDWQISKKDFKTQKHSKKTESIWLSPSTVKASKQLQLGSVI